MYDVLYVNYSSFVKDDITYRALPDLDDILSHPMPTRTMRSVTPPPIFTSGSHNGGKTYLRAHLLIDNVHNIELSSLQIYFLLNVVPRDGIIDLHVNIQSIPLQ